MNQRLVVVHERIAFWSRHLRPRLADDPVRLVESRSRADLTFMLKGSVGSIVVIDLGRRIRAGMEALDQALQVAPDALSLVIDPAPFPGVATLAREIGATHVVPSTTPPPRIAELLTRWIALAERRSESAGWFPAQPSPPRPEPWNWLTPLLHEWEASLALGMASEGV